MSIEQIIFLNLKGTNILIYSLDKLFLPWFLLPNFTDNRWKFYNYVPLMIVMPEVKKESQSIVTSLQQA
jgi:hypothetical protein